MRAVAVTIVSDCGIATMVKNITNNAAAPRFLKPYT